MRIPRASAIALVGALAIGCGGKKGAAGSRTGPPGSSSTKSRVENTTPLVIDWKTEARAELDNVIKGAVPILQYDERNVRLLPLCKADGSYTFAPSTRADHSFQLQTAEQIRETLPTSGASIAAKLGSQLENGTTIDVAMVMIGAKTTSRRSLRRAELKGDCDGATHFVRRAAVGAYVVRLGTKGSRPTVERMSRPDSPSNPFLQADGSISACQRGSSFASEPPPDCQAILRVDLQRIE